MRRKDTVAAGRLIWFAGVLIALAFCLLLAPLAMASPCKPLFEWEAPTQFVEGAEPWDNGQYFWTRKALEYAAGKVIPDA